MALVVAARNLPWFQEFMPQYLADMSWERFARLFVSYPVNFPLWYLRNLFLLALLSPLIYLFCRDRAGAIIWLVLLTVLWSHENIGTDIVSAESVLFFSLGAALAMHSVPLSKLQDFNAWLALALVWLAVNLVRSWVVFGPMPVEDAQTLALILFKISYLLGLWVVWFGYDFLVGEVPEQSPLWPWFGLSFYVFVAHQPLYNIVSENILGRIGHNDALHTANYGGAFVIYVFLPVVVIGGLSVLGALVRKQAPLVHRLLTGGR
jgi:succinoglycan biosynthesis protein ExoH